MLVSAQTQLDAPSVPISALTRRIGDHASRIVTRRENTGRDGTYEISILDHRIGMIFVSRYDSVTTDRRRRA